MGGYQIGAKTLLGYLIAFCIGVRSRCPMELFRKYLFLGPRGSYHWPRFYVQTNPKWEPGADYWYTNRPVGKNTFGVYRKHDEEWALRGTLKNHSMRKSTCTRLFRKGMDPQLIK